MWIGGDSVVVDVDVGVDGCSVLRAGVVERLRVARMGRDAKGVWRRSGAGRSSNMERRSVRLIFSRAFSVRIRIGPYSKRSEHPAQLLVLGVVLGFSRKKGASNNSIGSFGLRLFAAAGKIQLRGRVNLFLRAGPTFSRNLGIPIIGSRSDFFFNPSPPLRFETPASRDTAATKQAAFREPRLSPRLNFYLT